MNFPKHLFVFVFFLLYFCLIFPNKVFAYIDPGTGSYIIQLVVAGIFGGLFAIKIFWKKIKVFVKKIKGSNDDKQEN